MTPHRHDSSICHLPFRWAKSDMVAIRCDEDDTTGHLAVTTNTTRWNRPFAVVFGCCRLSLAGHHPLLIFIHTCWNQLSSARAHFRRLWAFSGCHHDNPSTPTSYNCRLSPTATTMTTHQPPPTNAEIKRSCSFLVGVCFLAATTINQPLTTAEHEHECSFLAIVGFLWPLPPLLSISQPLKSTTHAHFWQLWAFWLPPPW